MKLVQKFIIYILRIVIFTVFSCFLHIKIWKYLIEALQKCISFVTENSNIVIVNEAIELLLGIFLGLICLFTASIGVTYVFAKICGLFKSLDNLKKWQTFLIMVSISAVYIINADIIDKHRLMENGDIIGSIWFTAFSLIPSYLLYLFLNFLTKKYPTPFKQIGYFSSIKFYIDLIDNRKYYFSTQFLNKVSTRIKTFFLNLRTKILQLGSKNKPNNNLKKTKSQKITGILLILMVIFQTISLLFAIIVQRAVDTYNGNYYFIIFIGYLMCFALYFILKKQKEILLLAILFFLFSITYNLFIQDYFYADNFGECAHGYCSFVEQLTGEDNKYTVAHFPKTLPPKKVTSYRFLNDFSFKGDGADYVQFNTDKEFIEQTIKKNKENIEIALPLAKADSILRDYFDIVEKDIEKYTVYIMKKPNKSDNYTSGIIASKEKQNIIFFFARPKLNI